MKSASTTMEKAGSSRKARLRSRSGGTSSTSPGPRAAPAALPAHRFPRQPDRVAESDTLNIGQNVAQVKAILGAVMGELRAIRKAQDRREGHFLAIPEAAERMCLSSGELGRIIRAAEAAAPKGAGSAWILGGRFEVLRMNDPASPRARYRVWWPGQ